MPEAESHYPELSRIAMRMNARSIPQSDLPLPGVHLPHTVFLRPVKPMGSSRRALLHELGRIGRERRELGIQRQSMLNNAKNEVC